MSRDSEDDLIPLSDDEVRRVAGEFAYRASLLFKLHRLGLIREPMTQEEIDVVTDVRACFNETPGTGEVAD